MYIYIYIWEYHTEINVSSRSIFNFMVLMDTYNLVFTITAWFPKDIFQLNTLIIL